MIFSLIRAKMNRHIIGLIVLERSARCLQFFALSTA